MRNRIILGISAFVFLILIFNSVSVIKPGEAGVIFNRLTGSLREGEQGAIFYLPFFTKVESYPIALRTYTMVQRSGEGTSLNDDSIDLPSREGQHIKLDISITYNTSPGRAAEVFKAFRGADIGTIESSFIRRTLVTVSQNVAGSMSLVELISTKREDLQSQIQEKLNIEFLKMGFAIDKVNLGASHLPESVEKQMQQKMAAQQDAQRAEYELQKQTTLAKAHIVESEGMAKANQALQISLTPAILENKKIEKWNGVLPTVSGSQGLMLNMQTKQGETK